MNQIFKSKDGKVTVILTKLILGVEIYVLQKKFGAIFNINGKEIEENATLFFDKTSLTEGEDFLQRIGFIREDS